MTDLSNTPVAQAMQALGLAARQASREMARASTQQKNQVLHSLAAAISKERAALQAANQKDLEAARQADQDAAFIDRLGLSDKAIQTMVDGV
ncbi:MAG: gamma-glutamyl-phosphate reductase, partial [Burkholderiaceae bacterium]